MEEDNLSIFFMKVHAVEEKFLCLRLGEKKKALCILEASLKKLQTLSEACHLSLVVRDKRQDSPQPEKSPQHRLPEELKHEVKSETSSADGDTALEESSQSECSALLLDENVTGESRSAREVTLCESPQTEETTSEVCSPTKQRARTGNGIKMSPSSPLPTDTGSVLAPRKRRRPRKLEVPTQTEIVEETVRFDHSDDIDDDDDDGGDDGLEDDKALSEEQESSRKDKRSSKGKPSRQHVIKCELCGRKYKSEQTLKSHFRSHGFSPCSCLHCQTESMNFAAHLHHHCTRKLQVKISKGRQKRKMEQAENLPSRDEDTRSNQDSNLCQICGKILKSDVELGLHMKRQHKESPKPIPVHECKFCGRRFVKRVSVFIHFKQHAGNKMVCLKCGEFCEDFDAYSEHMAVHDLTATCQCSKCGMKFSREQQFTQHMRCHDRFDCVLCERYFTRRLDLFQHCRQAHGAIIPLSQSKPLQCQVCCRRFQHARQLQQHSRIHTGERPVHCDICRQWFRTPKSLNKHRKTRSHCFLAGTTFTKKDYLCSDCGKTFCRREAFRRHILYHKGVKPHTCQYCGYRCQERNNLNRHMMLHFQGQRNFVCEVCGAAFHAKKTLQMHHSYKHSSERCFPCPHCALSFKAKNALMRHTKVHTKVKEHRCWCGAAFNRQYNLRRHMRAVHGSDHTLPPLRKVTVLDVLPEDKDPDKVDMEDVDLHSSTVDYQTQDSVGAMLQHSGHGLEAAGAMATHQLSGMVLPPQGPPQQPPLQQNLGGEVSGLHYPSLPPQVTMGDYGGAEMAPPPPRQQDYFGGTSGMMMDNSSTPVGDLNSQYMYIQNILLPSVAMAGLMDLSNSGK